MAKNTKIHIFDYERSARDGERTKCGRSVYGLKWTYGFYSEQTPPFRERAVNVTCTSCLRVLKKVKQ